MCFKHQYRSPAEAVESLSLELYNLDIALVNQLQVTGNPALSWVVGQDLQKSIFTPSTIYDSNHLTNLWVKAQIQTNFRNLNAESSTETRNKIPSKPTNPSTRRKKVFPISLMNSFYHNANIIMSTLLYHSDKLQFLCTSAFFYWLHLIQKITSTVNKEAYYAP